MSTTVPTSPNGINWDAPMNKAELKLRRDIVMTALIRTVVSPDGTPPQCMDELAEHIMSSEIASARGSLAICNMSLSDEARAGQQKAGAHRLCSVAIIANQRQLTSLLLTLAGLTHHIYSPSNRFLFPFSRMCAEQPVVARARPFVMAGIGVPFFLHLMLPAKDKQIHSKMYWALMDPSCQLLQSHWNAAGTQPFAPFLDLRDERILVTIHWPMEAYQTNQVKLHKRMHLLRSDKEILLCTRNRCNLLTCVHASSTLVMKRLGRCGRCREASYCSRQHQIDHWSQHKRVCKRIQEALM
jgi:hypothetical protein